MSRITDAFVRRYQWYVRDPKARRKFKDLHILDSFESIQYILDHRCSVSRFGDGEFTLFLGGMEGYQEHDEALAVRLIEVLTATDAPNHVVGIPYFLKNVQGTVNLTRSFWGDFVTENGEKIAPYLSKQHLYIDTQISRFCLEYRSRRRSTRQLSLLKKIWDGRDLVIVEGTQSRTGVGNDLYDNARSIRRILGPATNAFSRYDDMLTAIQTNTTKDDLIMLSYGPSATILAYDLAKLGYQAIDIGHLDIEYEWYQRNITNGMGVAIEGKYTNEAADGHVVADCKDEKYLGQIVCDITKC